VGVAVRVDRRIVGGTSALCPQAVTARHKSRPIKPQAYARRGDLGL
jgi:hypothetical protein